MEVLENVYKDSKNPINLAITYMENEELEVNLESFSEEQKCELNALFQQLKAEENIDNRSDIADMIIDMVRKQLKSIEKVGEVLDTLKFCVKLFFIEKKSHSSDLMLLNDIFMILPTSWEVDPVKIHLISKLIYEIVLNDFNNIIFLLTKVICINKIGYYVGLTLWWTAFLRHFKKETHYYKMYNVEKFFKMLDMVDANDEELDINEFFQLIHLISIYQSYVILTKQKELNEEHHLFQDFFKINDHQREKLKNWLIRVKNVIELRNPVGKQNEDILMLLELLELDLIRTISQDNNQQTIQTEINANTREGDDPNVA